MTQLADDLRAAKALIDTPEEWIKGDFTDGHHGLCALGACGAHIVGDPDINNYIGFNTRVDMSVRALSDAVPGSGFNAADFNDDPATTHADIMALFDHAIAKADAA